MSDRHFEKSKITSVYKTHRPILPSEVVDVIVKFLRKGQESEPPWSLALDVGCGSGQSSAAFAPYFRRVVGVDPSPNQISLATASNLVTNVEFVVGFAETLPAPDGGTDLVAAMMAAHWFDLEKFYAEAKRVLRIGGVVALGASSRPDPSTLSLRPDSTVDSSARVSMETKLNRLLNDFHDSLDWPQRSDLLHNEYRDFPLPARFEVTRDESFVEETNYTLPDLIGFIASWSGYSYLMERVPGCSILEDLEREMKEVLGGETEFVYRCKHFVLLMRKVD